MRHTDLLVVGGGPAGLATALHAARAGLDTVVAEPRPAPVDKACGEGLMPGAVRALTALGLHAPGHPLTGIRYVQGPCRAEALFRRGQGLGVRRTDLHTVLHRAVLDAGVPVLPLRVDAVRQDADGVSVPGAGLRARWLVAADGLHSPLRRALGLDRPTRTRPRYGLRRHYAVPPWTSHVEVHWGPDAEAYVTPLGPRLAGVALLTSRRAPYDTQLAGFPELAARLPPDTAVTPVRGAGPLYRRSRARVHGRILFVGDAAGYVDALTGEGVCLALTGADALVANLRRGTPGRYGADWARATRRYRVLTELLVTARRQPALAPHIVPVAARLPRLFAAAVNALG
ncbi:NAD(P)/FAD-dependent oxidoreductase [Streptomyces cellulosae]|uniref:Flavin-dependent dehydrogenase n=1 Tax=Streptomyces thermodiastaticus TaxID=44061 RepID=A0ABU0KD03_9ACTN|nr:NAD(P)/FAD-dependent oxidoreductase [Streptomyces sp. McG8]MCX4475021.1 NAD(P)/FAD-dependent oxidoreductase [Streptomyces cellulosae]MDQ0487249.1 flavin-dependent dehydrogenase [Streptomyces thermodiastaticus]MDX3414417.1 NAD(P)/FAD-dependent oxidoreductase [Streptomyces sp. MD20-1-1]MXQ57974.1 FAD-dependent oxidoreductase [Streptomyces sp. XHT-2]MYW53773.1 FAD-dependent oxidoreductase [Streptomyces sp. SID8376]THC57459.1 NAD(P)/FAD-dependent oxidoreductase [Streptomyces sp. Akac8]UVT0796